MAYTVAAGKSPSAKTAGKTPPGLKRLTGASGFTLPSQSQKFTASGPFTAQTAGWYVVIGIGGGGGGGGSDGSGGGSGFAFGALVWLDKGETVDVVIGQGGAAGSTGNNGSPGGNTSFGSLAVFPGGGAGLDSGYGGNGGGGGGRAVSVDADAKGGAFGSDAAQTDGSNGLGQGAAAFVRMLEIVANLGSPWVLEIGDGGLGQNDASGGGGGGLVVDGAEPSGVAGTGEGYGGGGLGGDTFSGGQAGKAGILLVAGPVLSSPTL